MEVDHSTSAQGSRIGSAETTLEEYVKPAASLEYDAEDDFSRSIDECYAAVRERVRQGGKSWKPKD